MMAQNKPKQPRTPKPEPAVIPATLTEASALSSNRQGNLDESQTPLPEQPTAADVAREALRAIRTLEVELQVAMCGHLDQSQARKIAVMRAHFQRVIGWRV